MNAESLGQPDYILGIFANPAMLMVRADQIMKSVPPYVAYWLIWLLLIGASALLLAYWFREARYVALAYVGGIGAGLIMPRIIGAENYVYGSISVAHVIFWTPAVIAIYLRRSHIKFASAYGAWLIAATATMTFSLIVDWKDAISYLGLVLSA
jgi:hypothetical protein